MEQLLNFRITNDMLKMEIKLSDLVFLFEYSPNNVGNDIDIAPDGILAKVKCGKWKEFAEWFVETLQDQSYYNENDTVWGCMFEEAFGRLFEGYDDGDEFLDRYGI
jgi:hypothetical protein